MEYKPDYTKYDQLVVSVSSIDAIIKNLLSSTVGTWSKVIWFFQLIALVAWYYIRSKIIDHEMMIERQRYEQQEHKEDEEEVNV